MIGWIDDQADLDILITDIHAADIIGLDTEFLRVSTFHPKPGLIQVAIDQTAYLIDPLANIDLEKFGKALVDGPTCILHAAQEDFEVLYRLTGSIPTRVFDTQIAHSLVTKQISISLSALAKDRLRFELQKEETRSNWTIRPLTTSQCNYAKQDVLILIPLYQILIHELQIRGRIDWMTEEMESVVRKTNRILVEGDSEAQIQRFGNAWRLSKEGMSRLVHIVNWRDRVAREIDWPRKKILSDQSVFSIAKKGLKRGRYQLVMEHGLTDKQASKFADALKSVVGEAENCRGLRPPPPPLSGCQKDTLKLLQKGCEEIALRLDISKEVLIRKRHLIAAVDGRGWMPSGWRKNLLEGIFTNADSRNF